MNQRKIFYDSESTEKVIGTWMGSVEKVPG
jgi:hypothetical protein